MILKADISYTASGSRFSKSVKEILHVKLTMPGTGNALVTECYNTCFVLEDNGQYFMVDGGMAAQIQLVLSILMYHGNPDCIIMHI